MHLTNNNYLTPVIEPYNQLLKDIVYHGVKTDCTYALYNKAIHFDVESMNEDGKTQLFIPYNRGFKKGALGYGIAESIWYRRKTQDPTMISHFAGMWNQMKNEEGLIQSNYGYQLYENNDMHEFNRQFMNFLKDSSQEKFVYSLFIASDDNQHDRSDLVCNNKIEIIMEKDRFTKHIHIKSVITSRSIDVIYGLPYDFFTAHGFLAMLKEKINEVLGLNHATIQSISFYIANVHWYFRDKPCKEALNELSNYVISIDNEFTPYTIYLSNHKINNFTLDEIKEQRLIAKNSSFIIEYYCNPMRNYNFNYCQIIHHKDIDSQLIYNENVNEINQYFNFKSAKDIQRLKDVIQILKQNKWDRKTLIFDNNQHLNYIMFNGENFILTKVN